MTSLPTTATLPAQNLSRFFARWVAAGGDQEPSRQALIQELGGLSLTPVTFANFLQKETRFLRKNGLSDAANLPQALRRVRNLLVCTLIERDLAGQISLHDVVTAMSEFADFSLQTALDSLQQELLSQFGQPVSESTGAEQTLIVLGMGKLGGRELNISSDIDLIFIYPEDGETRAQAGQKSLSNHEYFSRLGKKLIAALSEIGEDGFTFRVDMALRPNGASGPLVASFAMLEEYLMVQGREWERYAWVKARAITGDPLQISSLERIVQPFVYRRYLDFSVIDALRAMHSQIRAEVLRYETRHPERANNVKLGRGGIREIEFLTQVFQLIRGGREVRLRNRSTRETLKILADLSIMDPTTVARLLDAYTFLRNLEHRLQYLDDAQTHNMPANPDDAARIAKMMGYPDLAELNQVLTAKREFVAAQFDIIFGARDTEAVQSETGFTEGDHPEMIQTLLTRLNFTDIDQAVQLLTRSMQSPRLRSLSEGSKNKCMVLINRGLRMIALLPDQHGVTLQRLLDLLEAIVRRSSYLALLIEYPQILQRLVRMMHASEWATRYLIKHPILLDELMDISALHQSPDLDGFGIELADQLAEHSADIEKQLNLLREAHHAQLFRLLAQDLEGMLSVERLADLLSKLADIMVKVMVAAIWQTIPQRHREVPQFAVLAYGKLGGKELGYASDLDVVFIYDDDDQEAPTLYARLAQRFITWMTTPTSAGILFDIDTALRPDGASGLMVSSVQSFERYQLQSAWCWEHQALSRARCCAAPPELAQRLDNLREQVLTRPRDAQQLRQDVLAMRQKMRSAHAVPSDKFDLKHSPGGMIDIEFMVQYLVLRYAHQYPQLCANDGNIALLISCGELGLIPSEAALTVADIYRQWRKMQHLGRLQGTDQAWVKAESWAPQIQRVTELWHILF